MSTRTIDAIIKANIALCLEGYQVGALTVFAAILLLAFLSVGLLRVHKEGA